MTKDLHDCSKEELINIIQDYQEMTSDIEEVINRNLDNSDYVKVLLGIRKIIMRWIHDKA